MRERERERERKRYIVHVLDLGFYVLPEKIMKSAFTLLIFYGILLVRLLHQKKKKKQQQQRRQQQQQLLLLSANMCVCVGVNFSDFEIL